jgi:hypothetical protein
MSGLSVGKRRGKISAEGTKIKAKECLNKIDIA